ncbi:MAG: DNA replication and repair protein RecF [Balneolaceae bacterium]
MRNRRLTLHNFRNHSETSVEWASHLNVITGPNGAGKTNLIDAVHYLCMSRSFVSTSDRYVVGEEESGFLIRGDFEGEIRSRFSVACSYSRGEGKRIFVNDSPLEKHSDLIGMVPVVVLSPEDRRLTAEGPAERRAFLDGFISQISISYLKDLISYRRVRKQRNRLLQEYHGPERELRLLLEPWDSQLVEAGSRIVATRTLVLNRFRAYLETQYRSFSGMELKPDLSYQTFCEPDGDPAVVQEKYRESLDREFEKEVEREQTLIGPHRDEIVFYLGGMELRNYGSQGQHRLFSVALKLAQLFYYSDELEDLPVMLLDDVFGNLDTSKTDVLLQTLLNHPGQSFVTSATEDLLRGLNLASSLENRHFRVLNGNVDLIH